MTAIFRKRTNPYGDRRTGRFLARLDAHLHALPDDAARRAFLDAQIEGWERRYARFVATDGASEPVAARSDPPQAADFVLTLTGLAARRAVLRGMPLAKVRPSSPCSPDRT
jgi:hypothetical protein